MFKVGNFRTVFWFFLLHFICAVVLPFRLSQKGRRIYFGRVYMKSNLFLYATENQIF